MRAGGRLLAVVALGVMIVCLLGVMPQARAQEIAFVGQDCRRLADRKTPYLVQFSSLAVMTVNRAPYPHVMVDEALPSGVLRKTVLAHGVMPLAIDAQRYVYEADILRGFKLETGQSFRSRFVVERPQGPVRADVTADVMPFVEVGIGACRHPSQLIRVVTQLGDGRRLARWYYYVPGIDYYVASFDGEQAPRSFADFDLKANRIAIEN